jgi:hypothetical protein
MKTIGISFILSCALCVSPAFAGDHVLTNADLERYRDSENIAGSAGMHIDSGAGSQPSTSTRADNGTGERWKQHYCYFGKKYQDIIDETEEEAKACWEDYKKYKGDKKAFESRRCKNVRLENERAHKAYDDLANEAMRKGYPVGWLRCQYE